MRLVLHRVANRYKQTLKRDRTIGMGPFFIDFEAFQHGSGKFLIKELCILDIDRPLFPLYFLFEPLQEWSTLTTAQK